MMVLCCLTVNPVKLKKLSYIAHLLKIFLIIPIREKIHLVSILILIMKSPPLKPLLGILPCVATLQEWGTLAMKYQKMFESNWPIINLLQLLLSQISIGQWVLCQIPTIPIFLLCQMKCLVLLSQTNNSCNFLLVLEQVTIIDLNPEILE